MSNIFIYAILKDFFLTYYSVIEIRAKDPAFFKEVVCREEDNPEILQISEIKALTAFDIQVFFLVIY